MERSGRHDESEGPAVREVLEGGYLEPGHRVRDVAPGSLDHRGADIDGSQVERPPGQLPGELACAAADLEHGGGPRADRGSRENGVDDLGEITLAGGVIQLGDAVEKTPLPLPRPALLVTLGGHDPSLPRTSASSEAAARMGRNGRLRRHRVVHSSAATGLFLRTRTT